MKTKYLPTKWLCLLIVLAGWAQFQPAYGQAACGLSFTGPYGNVLTGFIDSYPNYPNSDATFNTVVQDTSEPLPEGTYLTWCVDANTFIDPSQGGAVGGTIYTGLLFPTCDTNLNNELPTNHPSTVYVSPAVWQEVNYILNHKNGAYFWDVQVAINDLVGGPPLGPSPPYPPFDANVVNSLLSAAGTNASTWTPQCGDTIGAVYVIQEQSGVLLTNAVQLILLEVPYCPITFTNCPPDLSLGCNPTNVPDCQNPVTAAGASSCCGYPVSISCSKSESVAGCCHFRFLVYTATDGYGNSATCMQTIAWTVDTNAPVVVSAPTNSNLGCNPPSLPTVATVKAQVVVADNCTAVTTNVSCQDSGTPCGMTRTFLITATDGCGNVSAPKTVTYIWTIDTNAPVIVSAPTNSNLGCNPPSLPTVATVKAQVVVADNCSVQSTNVSCQDSGTPCGMTRTFLITATDGCGNVSAPKTVIYSWTIDTNAPVIVSGPTNSNLGCNPAMLPSDASVKAQVVALDNCSIQATNVSHADVTNYCTITRTFTINVTDGCGNFSTNRTVVYTWISDTNAPVVNCPPDVTISNMAPPYCTYTPGEWGAPCNGTNASSILTNCFKKIYTNGYVQCGGTNSGYWLKFTTCTNAQKFTHCGGAPGCLKGNYTNVTNCEAGLFGAQVLALKLNVDFGDAGSVTGFGGGCGNLVLNDTGCPLHGQSVRQILSLCNLALCGGNISWSGCTISNLTVICSNLNQSFECGAPSGWGCGHLVPPAITNVSPTVTGYATVIDKCSSTPTLTYTDSITAGTCAGNYTIARTWTAVDACGNSSSCTQNIYVGGSAASACGYVFLDCNGDGFLTPGIDVGLSNVTVTLTGAKGTPVATNTTGSDGSYCFYNLTPGTYTVSVAPPAGYSQTAGTHTNHWLNSSWQQCWIENDGYQHCKGGDGVDRWTANDGYQHWKSSNNQDCWLDKFGKQHSQSCTYTSCDVPKGNQEAFTLAACQALTCVNFAYVGVAPKTVVCVTGPSYGICGQTGTYTCCVTNTGTTCFTSCQVTACGKTYTCPPLSPGQGCSFPVNYQYQWSDFGWFGCQASASCTYPTSNTPWTGQGNCNTFVYW